jgi:hypothetical protein
VRCWGWPWGEEGVRFFASFLKRCEEDRSNFSEIVENVMQANCKNINKVPLLSLARVY